MSGGSRATRWIAGLCVAISGLACDPTTDPADGAVDAAVDAARALSVAVAIEGPTHAYVDRETCFTALFDPSVDGAELDWVFGDGARLTTRDAQACHTYERVGATVLGVSLRVGARSADATRPLSVVFEPAAVPPTHSTSITAVGPRVLVVNPDADTIAILTREPLALEREVAVGDHPRTLAVSDARIAVACQGDGTLHLLGLDGSASAVASFGPGTEPYGVLADPRGGAFFVSLRGAGQLAVVTPDGGIAARIDVGPEPRGLAMNAEGTLLATRWRATPEGAHVYTLDASDAMAPTLVGETALAPQEDIDSDTDNSGVLSFLNQLVPSPEGRRAVLPGLKANVVTGAFRTGEPLTSQTTARAALGEVTFGAPGGLARDSFRHSFDDLGFASAAVFSPQGERLFVAFQGAQTVVAVDAFDFFSVGSIDAVGEAPQGLALSEDGGTLYVHAFLSRSVRAYAVADLSREPPLLAEVGTVGAEPLSAQVLDGKRIFHRSRDPRMSRTRYLSCASCHLDGEGDGLVWDFTQRGEGLRNTISLRGAGGRAPLHWSANFDEVQDFEHDIRGGQGGAGFLDDAVFMADGHDAPLGTSKAGLSVELDALAAYVESLVSVGAAPAQDEDAVIRGRVVFDAAGCRTCHSGPFYSDSAFVAGSPILHDVGTLGEGSGQRLGETLAGIDTPTLRGLWRTAPYLHDGSAATVREVLTTRNPGDLHGVTSTLTGPELDDLLAFLRSLGD